MSEIKFHDHPYYATWATKWRTYRDLEEGDHATLTGSPRYLWPHELESSTQAASFTDDGGGMRETVGQKLRRIRALRSRYYNLFEPVISTWVSMAFAKPAKLSPEMEKLLGEDAKDIDGNGTSLEDFIKMKVAWAYFRDGNPVIEADAPENSTQSREQEQAIGFRPFLDLLDRLEVRDWQLVESGIDKGKYQWVRHEYSVIDSREGPEDEPKHILYSRTTKLTPEGVVVLIHKSEDGKWVSVGESVLGSGWTEIPISTINTNDPWVRDASELQLVLFNLMSAYFNQLNMQAFQRVFIAGDLGDKHKISISEYSVSQIPTEAKPYVIEPSSTDALTSGIDRTVDQFYRVAFNRTRGLTADSKEAPSASTLREMATELAAVLVQAVGEIEGLINRALRHYAMFKVGPEKGAAFVEGVTLSRDISVDDVMAGLEKFAAYRDEIRKILPWRKAHLRKVAVSMGYSDEETKEILTAIDELKDDPVISPIGALPVEPGASGDEGGVNGGDEEGAGNAAEDQQTGEAKSPGE